MATWFDIHGCAFWSHKDSELAVILFIQLSPFERQYGLTYKASPLATDSKRLGRVVLLLDLMKASTSELPGFYLRQGCYSAVHYPQQALDSFLSIVIGMMPQQTSEYLTKIS